MKLLVSKADLKRLLALDFVAQAVCPDGVRTRKLVSSYYDTADLAFMQQGIAYRVRDKGDGTYEATVKTSAKSSGGLSRRVELNLPLPTAEPVLEGFAELGLDYELSELAPEGVQKLFTVKVERTTYILDLGGTMVELAVDHGKIGVGKNSDKIDEIEIELLQGETGALLDFAAKLAASIPLFVEKRSKFARGLALCGIPGSWAETKSKMGSGRVREELLSVVQQHGDALLNAQNTLQQVELELAAVKEVRRQLLYLRSYGSMAAALAGEEYAGKAVLEECLQAVNRLRAVRSLQQHWSSLAQQGATVLGKTPLTKRLAAAGAEAQEQLQQLLRTGRLTALYYALLSWLYNVNWENEDYLEADAAARCCLKEWLQQQEEATDLQERLVLADNIVLLARSISGKYFLKLAEAGKKERRRLQKQAEAAQWQDILQEIRAVGTSKVLHRDIGVVLGWMLAQGGK